MTEPKNLLKSKLQSRLNQKASAPVQGTGGAKSKNQVATQQPSKAHAPTPKSTDSPHQPHVAEKVAGRAKKAAAGDNNATNMQVPSEYGNFTQQLEELISQRNQPTDSAPETIDQTQSQEQQQAITSARRDRLVKEKEPKQPKSPRSLEEKRQRYRVMIFYGLATLMVLLDQLTKGLAKSVLMDESIRVTSWFDLILVFNPGAAFSLLANSGWQRPFLVGVSLLVSVVLIIWLPRTPQHKLVLPLALTCILGGAFGNLIDRALYGYVVDFISVHYQQLRFPTFNFADSMITIGAVLLIIDMVIEERAKARDRKQQKLGAKPMHAAVQRQPDQQQHHSHNVSSSPKER